MYKVVMVIPSIGKRIDMPKDHGLGLFCACHRADIYKGRNNTCWFLVVNEDNGDVMYET